MDKRALSIQIARLLTQSNEYKCGFTVVGDSIYAFPNTHGSITPFEIDPAMYLESVKAVRYDDKTV